MFGEVVAVTGDGMNDAPALHESDIGLAMGIAGTEIAKKNAHVIIMDDNFTTIVNVAKWGRAVYINIVALVINFVSACITGVIFKGCSNHSIQLVDSFLFLLFVVIM
ncbi:putative calcium-transporting ATPase 11, plasma membrane-type [Stylosanthes scabra]|uniref:Calcium-transporting ATPase 11, plasma membrane-type n=1 Tax=Stylosanthes scabra TaxID=79078 RepID=A0ABU6QKK2_9FABA|nr:putative calcium-transporting ATPase 11, plasma membrane-type [Stylosanthes scabra]